MSFSLDKRGTTIPSSAKSPIPANRPQAAASPDPVLRFPGTIPSASPRIRRLRIPAQHHVSSSTASAGICALSVTAFAPSKLTSTGSPLHPVRLASMETHYVYVLPARADRQLYVRLTNNRLARAYKLRTSRFESLKVPRPSYKTAGCQRLDLVRSSARHRAVHRPKPLGRVLAHRLVELLTRTFFSLRYSFSAGLCLLHRKGGSMPRLSVDCHCHL